jgi:anhydro-N-acetylmuramic acid kinase
VIGLMSGTSMDGIDAALLVTDGDGYISAGGFSGSPYPDALRRTLLSLPAAAVDLADIERQVTDLQAQAVRDLCVAEGLPLGAIDLVGFHGQTILHEPQMGRTWQLGDGQRMANTLRIPVVTAFRQNDMQNGGQGAPLAPAYHRALVRSCALPEPVAVLNIGGVSNCTLIDGARIYACDCGPGNALIDDWVRTCCGVNYDEGGRIAMTGCVDAPALARLLGDPYFQRSGPKSLDRNAFSLDPVAALPPASGAATLSAFTAAAIALEAQRLPVVPGEWIIVGGGRHNAHLLGELRARLGGSVRTAEDVAWNGDAIEAQAFGYLAVRSALGTPLSWPETTGVSSAVSGGIQWQPQR